MHKLRRGVKMAHGMWTPTAQNFANHQLSHVLNFWKLGHGASFRLDAQSGGKAEMTLTFDLPAPCDHLPPPQYACPPPLQPRPSGECLQKASLGRMRRREKRAFERAAAEETEKLSAAVENASAMKAATENDIKTEVSVGSDITTKADTVDSDVAGRAAPEVTVAVKTAPTAATASTSCFGSQQLVVAPVKAPWQRCQNCDESFSIDHQCAVQPNVGLSPGLKSPEMLPPRDVPPLPLCHYCCHRGSGENPVHYYLQCLCLDKKCTCQCYCTEEQLKHRKNIYPEGFSDGNPVDPSDRPRAKAIAEERADKLNGHRPCDSENCVKPL